MSLTLDSFCVLTHAREGACLCWFHTDCPAASVSGWLVTVNQWVCLSLSHFRWVCLGHHWLLIARAVWFRPAVVALLVTLSLLVPLFRTLLSELQPWFLDFLSVASSRAAGLDLPWGDHTWLSYYGLHSLLYCAQGVCLTFTCDIKLGSDVVTRADLNETEMTQGKWEDLLTIVLSLGLS